MWLRLKPINTIPIYWLQSLVHWLAWITVENNEIGWGTSENLLKRPSSYYLGRGGTCGSWKVGMIPFCVHRMVLTRGIQTELWKEQKSWWHHIFGSPTQNNPAASDRTNFLGPAGIWSPFVKSAFVLQPTPAGKQWGWKAEDPSIASVSGEWERREGGRTAGKEKKGKSRKKEEKGAHKMLFKTKVVWGAEEKHLCLSLP